MEASAFCLSSWALLPCLSAAVTLPCRTSSADLCPFTLVTLQLPCAQAHKREFNNDQRS